MKLGALFGLNVGVMQEKAPSKDFNFEIDNVVKGEPDANKLIFSNALNTLIKSLNGGVLDTRFIVNWQDYKNSILLTNGPDLRKLDTAIHKIVDFSRN